MMTEETGTGMRGVRAQVAMLRRPRLSCRSRCRRSLKALRSRPAAIGTVAVEALSEGYVSKERKKKMRAMMLLK